jgi:hypothetical protein
MRAMLSGCGFFNLAQVLMNYRGVVAVFLELALVVE